MPTWKYYILMSILFLLSWVPASLEFTLALHSQQNLSTGKMLDVLLFIPFIAAFFSGLVLGFNIIWKLVLVSIFTLLIRASVYIFDLNKVDGGWRVYASFSGLFIEILTGAIGIFALTLLGAFAKKLFWH